jgi:hypothetical protein
MFPARKLVADSPLLRANLKVERGSQFGSRSTGERPVVRKERRVLRQVSADAPLELFSMKVDHNSASILKARLGGEGE